MGAVSSKKQQKKIHKSQKVNESVEERHENAARILKELLAKGDQELASKLSTKLSNGGKVMDSLIKNKSTLGTAYDLFSDMSSLFQIAEKALSAVQVAGVVFSFISVALDIVGNYREANESASKLYDTLKNYWNILQELTSVHSTQKRDVDENIKKYFNNVCIVLLESYEYLQKFTSQNKIKKVIFAKSEIEKIEVFTSALSSSWIDLQNNLFIYILRNLNIYSKLIPDLDARKIWEELGEKEEHELVKVMEGLKLYYQKNISSDLWFEVKDRIQMDLDMDNNAIIHFSELQKFSRQGLNKILKKYTDEPDFTTSKNILTARNMLKKYLLSKEPISTSKVRTASFFIEGTRKGILDNIENWLTNEKSSIFCVEAKAGIGKSVISYQVLQRHVESCIGYFFFEFNISGRSSLTNAIYSILLQLSEKYPEIRDYIVRELEDEDRKRQLTENLSNLLNLLLVGALKLLPKKDLKTSYFLLFDALDEVTIESERRELVRFFGNLENSKDPSLPKIKILFTTRPEQDIMNEMKRASLDVKHIDQFDEINKRDITIYAQNLVEKHFFRLTDKSNDAKQKMLELLVERSQGVFLWLKIADDWFAEQTGVSLDKIESSLAKGLNGIYNGYFDRLFSNRSQSDIDEIFSIMQVLLCCYEKLNFTQIAWLLNKTSEEDQFDLKDKLECIQSIFPSNSQGFYAPVHKSISDFVLEKDSSFFKPYGLKVNNVLKETHKKISDFLLSQLFNAKEGPNFDVSKLRVQFYRDSGYLPVESGKESEWINKWEYLPELEDMYLCFMYGMKFVFQHLQDFQKSAIEKKKYKEMLWNPILLDFFYVKYYLGFPTSSTLLDCGYLKSVIEFDLTSWMKRYNHQFQEKPFLLFEIAYQTEKIHEIGKLWAENNKNTTDSKILWLNSPLLSNDPCIQTLTRSNFYVTCCAYSPDGQWIVSGATDKLLKIHNSATGQLLHTLQGHTDNVNSCKVSPDGQWIVSGSNDKTLKIWSSTSGQLLQTLQGHTGNVNCCAVSPDGKWIVSVSSDKTLKIWNSSSGQLLNTFQGHTAIVRSCAISPDGQWIVTGSLDKTLMIWNSSTGQILHTLQGHTDVKCCVISPDGKWIVSSSSDKTLKIWNSATGQLLHTLQGHTDFVSCCAISPDGKWIASGGDRTVRVWDSSNGKLLYTLLGHVASLYCCAISPDGQTIITASADKTLKFWNCPIGQTLNIPTGHTEVLSCYAVSPNGQWIVTGSGDRTLKIWNSSTGQLLHTLQGHTGYVNCCAVTPDGQKIVSGSGDETLKIWSSSTGQLLHTLEGHTGYVNHCVISPNGEWIVSVSDDKTLKIWNSSNGQLLHSLEGHTEVVSCFAISADGQFIVSGSIDTTLKIWNSSTGQLLHTLQGHTGYVNCCVVSPDGKWIVSGSGDQTLKIWNSSNGQLLHTFQDTSSINYCAVSPDGQWILSGSEDEKLKIWNSSTGKNVIASNDFHDSKVHFLDSCIYFNGRRNYYKVDWNGKTKMRFASPIAETIGPVTADSFFFFYRDTRIFAPSFCNI